MSRFLPGLKLLGFGVTADVKRILTIGPSDSSGATGIQADLRIFAELGATGLCAVTAVLATDGTAVRRTFFVPPRTIEAQIDAVARRGVDATKIVALHDRTLVDAIAERVRRRRLRPVVLDPGILDAGGRRVLGRNGVDWLRRRLLPQVTVIVLERAEVEILTGAEIADETALRAALTQVRRAGPTAVLVPGSEEESPAWLANEEGVQPLKVGLSTRRPGRDRFTAALAVRLALGDAIIDAIKFASDYIAERRS